MALLPGLSCGRGRFHSPRDLTRGSLVAINKTLTSGDYRSVPGHRSANHLAFILLAVKPLNNYSICNIGASICRRFSPTELSSVNHYGKYDHDGREKYGSSRYWKGRPDTANKHSASLSFTDRSVLYYDKTHQNFRG